MAWNQAGILTLAIILSIFPLLIMLNLHRGLDMSDTAFYHLAIAEREQMNSIVTQFGVVWGILPFHENILWFRWANFIALSVSGAFAFISAFKVYSSDKTPTLYTHIFLGLIGAGSTCLYYIFWLPGPSYNSLGLALNLGLIGFAAAMVSRLRQERPIPVMAAVCGGMIVALALTRAPSALFTGVSLSLIVLILARPNFRTTLKIVGFSALGGLAFIVLTSILVEPIWITLDRIQTGMVLTNEIGSTSPFGQRSKALVDQTLTIWTRDWLFIILASLAGCSTFNLPNKTLKNILRYSITLLATVGFCVIIWPMFMKGVDGVNVTIIDVAQMAAGLLGASFLIAVIRIVTSRDRPSRRNAATLVLFIIALAFILIGQVFGTGNNWFSFSGAFPVFAILAISLALCGERPQFGFNLPVFILCLIILPLQVTIWKSASEVPYRLPSSLSEQVIRTDIRGGHSTLWLDSKTHNFLAELDTLRPAIDALEERPILINLTGGTPLIAYHLDMDVPGTPWLPGGKSWSADFAKHQIDQIDPIRLCQAWFVIAEDSPRALSTEFLMAKDLDLQRGYTRKSIADAPYINVPIEILSPPLTGNACLDTALKTARVESL